MSWKARGQRPKVAGVQEDAKSHQEGRRPRGNGGEIERREISECEAQGGEARTQHC